MSNKKSWSLEFGLYPGIMIGIRSYQEETQTAHVLYLPFVDFAFISYK
jgi:hypothetical protein